ncbi:hypothetical protein COOONC_14867 [Cooperia oncophora]
MSRSEKTLLDSPGEDRAEKTFDKLYKRYVKDEDTKSDNEKGSYGKAKGRSFISHSEAEEEPSSDEELSPTELDNSFAEQLRNIREKMVFHHRLLSQVGCSS